jgi:TPP-dependent indolepyruvate ferredoxin oxidoreductase alpha subunit
MGESKRILLSGDEAVALAAYDSGLALGTGYPGTPSTEILEAFSQLGGRAQWAPNEKVAAEVALGVAFAGANGGAMMHAPCTPWASALSRRKGQRNRRAYQRGTSAARQATWRR